MAITVIGHETDSLRERFWAKVEKTDSCWNWTASTCGRGYGQFFLYKMGSRPYMGLAHRVAYELSVGPIPEGLTIDHLCRNILCVNPSHLEPVTQLENNRRGPRPQGTHCPQGHPYDSVHSWIVKKTGVIHTAQRCSICRRNQGRAKDERVRRRKEAARSR